MEFLDEMFEGLWKRNQVSNQIMR